MSKRLTLICVFVIAVALALPAYAAVQNIKISGDVAVRSIVRTNYDLDKNDTNTTGSTPGNNDETFFMHSVGVNIGADLTDNVSVVTRIINQRDWDNNSSGAATFDADIDLAYVALKEFFFTPLTVNIGRQDLWYGKGFIVGAKLLDFNGSISADEYTETAAFDAVRATIDLNDAWVLGLAYAKVDENTVSASDDVDLYICNLGHRLNQNNAEAEVYFVTKIDKGPQLQAFPTLTGVPATDESQVGKNTVYTLGVRGSMDVPENILAETTIAGEIAHQSGEYTQTAGPERDRDAWALDVSAEKGFSNVMWKPKLALEYILYSGENTDASTATGEWNAWDPVYRGKFDTAIREFQNYYYATRFRAQNVGTAVVNSGTEVDMDSGLTNEKQLILSGTIYPINKLTLKGALAQFWLDDALSNANGTHRSTNLGQELDVLLTYDYSSDVSFSLLWGTFFPGKYWMADQNDRAMDVVGSVKLTF